MVHEKRDNSSGQENNVNCQLHSAMCDRLIFLPPPSQNGQLQGHCPLSNSTFHIKRWLLGHLN